MRVTGDLVRLSRLSVQDVLAGKLKAGCACKACAALRPSHCMRGMMHYGLDACNAQCVSCSSSSSCPGVARSSRGDHAHARAGDRVHLERRGLSHEHHVGWHIEVLDDPVDHHRVERAGDRHEVDLDERVDVVEEAHDVLKLGRDLRVGLRHVHQSQAVRLLVLEHVRDRLVDLGQTRVLAEEDGRCALDLLDRLGDADRADDLLMPAPLEEPLRELQDVLEHPHALEHDERDQSDRSKVEQEVPKAGRVRERVREEAERDHEQAEDAVDPRRHGLARHLASVELEQDTPECERREEREHKDPESPSIWPFIAITRLDAARKYDMMISDPDDVCEPLHWRREHRAARQSVDDRHAHRTVLRAVLGDCSVTLSLAVAMMLRNLHKDEMTVPKTGQVAWFNVLCDNGKYLETTSSEVLDCSAPTMGDSTLFQLDDFEFALTESGTNAKITVAEQLSGILNSLFPKNIFISFVDGVLLSVITFSIAFGAAATRATSRENSPLLDVLNQMNKIFYFIITRVIDWSPLAVLSLVAGSLSSQSSLDQALTHVGILVLCNFITVFLFELVFYPIVIFLLIRKNPFKYMRMMLSAATFAFGSASSLATLPISIRCVESTREVSRGLLQFVITIGSTVHMNGTAMFFPNAGLVMLYSIWSTIFSREDVPVTYSYLVATYWCVDRMNTMCNVLGDTYVARIIAEQVDEAYETTLQEDDADDY